MLRTIAQTAAPATSRRLLALALGALGLAFFVLHAGSANASVAWCDSDPIIMVNGQLISVVISVPVDQKDNVESAVVVFHVPSNVKAKVVFVDQSVFPEQAKIVNDLPRWNGRGDLLIQGELRVRSHGESHGRSHGDNNDFSVRVTVRDARETPVVYDGQANDDLDFIAYGNVRP